MRAEKAAVHKRIFLAFSDLAILVALKDQSITGYGINKYLMRKIGDTASPSTIYSTLAAIEKKLDKMRQEQNRAGLLLNRGRQKNR